MTHLLTFHAQLMSERNLRAMDMRHTLPNLKNLLLTLTNGSPLKSPIRYLGTALINWTHGD